MCVSNQSNRAEQVQVQPASQAACRATHRPLYLAQSPRRQSALGRQRSRSRPRLTRPRSVALCQSASSLLCPLPIPPPVHAPSSRTPLRPPRRQSSPVAASIPTQHDTHETDRARARPCVPPAGHRGGPRRDGGGYVYYPPRRVVNIYTDSEKNQAYGCDAVHRMSNVDHSFSRF